MPPVLVTNDDGVHAPGILALAKALRDDGVDIVIAAPLDDRSGSGAAIGGWHMTGGVDFKRLTLDGLEDVPTYGVDGPPALAAMVANLGGFGEPPEIVVSGINPGCNTGRAVLHSGTVGAALAAANFGRKGMAVSLDSGEHLRWSTAGEMAVGLLPWLKEAPVKTVINVNVPNLDLADLAGVRRAELAPFGTVRAAIVDSAGGRFQMEFRSHDEKLPADTDTALVWAGFVAVTPLVGVRAAPVTEGASSRASDPVSTLERHLADRIANEA